jgi:glycosyltransferase involved in cell wall biosynthesis
VTTGSTEGGTPFFSVVIPTYRRPDLLVQALESVTAQTFFDYEVIVIDDDPDRSARAVVESAAADRPDVRFAYHENDQAKGGSGARNAGLARAGGTWVAFLDDDDTWLPDKLAAVHAVITTSQDADLTLVYTGNIKYDFGTGRVVSTSHPRARGRVLNRVLYENCVGGMSVVVARRDVLQSIGGLDERFMALQDMELYVRLAERGTFDFVADPLVRIRSSNRDRITVNPRKKLQGSQLFAHKYGALLRRSARLRHRAASRTFVFAFAAQDYGAALRSAPWTAAGVIVDPSNLIYVFKSLARQLTSRRVRQNHAIPASSR